MLPTKDGGFGAIGAGRVEHGFDGDTVIKFVVSLDVGQTAGRHSDLTATGVSVLIPSSNSHTYPFVQPLSFADAKKQADVDNGFSVNMVVT